MRLHRLAAAFLTAVVWASAARAEEGAREVVLVGGDVLRGRVVPTDDGILLEHAALGAVEIGAAQILEIRGGLPEGSTVVVPVAAPAPAHPGAPDLTTFEKTVDCVAPAEVESPWSWWVVGALGLGQGNSDFFDIRGEAGAKYEKGPWLITPDVVFVYGEQDGSVNANNWRARLHAERKISAKAFLFSNLQYDRDPLADLDYRFSAVGGFGWTFAESRRGFLKGEVGGGGVWERRSGMSRTVDPAAYLGLEYERRWEDGRRLTADLDFLPYIGDFDLSTGTFETHYINPLTNGIFLDIGLRLNYVVDPPGDVESLDTLLTVGFRVEF
ncbi:MAG: DUF481 domain-containing protein [Planctomycetota bacterium]|jgi:hypothetical protein